MSSSAKWREPRVGRPHRVSRGGLSKMALESRGADADAASSRRGMQGGVRRGVRDVASGTAGGCARALLLGGLLEERETLRAHVTLQHTLGPRGLLENRLRSAYNQSGLGPRVRRRESCTS